MRKLRYNVITFPGSNCDNDAFWVARLHSADCEFVWHKESALKSPDVVVLPGGFSYGDYLRCGAIAKYSSIMKAVVEFAVRGGLVIGICNGFQILTESGLLPGTLLMNDSLHFICQHQYVRVENAETAFTCCFNKGDVVDFPIAHKEGNYFIDEIGLQRLKDNGQIVFRYEVLSVEGEVLSDKTSDSSQKTPLHSPPSKLNTPFGNPNGSIDDIAGIINEKGNVLGMMPHPERSAEGVLPSDQGSLVFQSINRWINEHL